jgi:hypothetical protein
MNILYFFAEDETYMTQWQRIHIFDELSHYEHSIEVYNPLHYRNVTEANEKLCAFINNSTKKFDLFMTCVGSDTIYKSTIEDIKKFGLPTMLICFDNLHAPFMHKSIASSFDLVWLTSYETKWMFEKWGCDNIVVQSYAANPFMFKPRWMDTIPTVDFIGTPYGSRVNKINFLTNHDVPCTIYADSAVQNSHSNVPAKDKKVLLQHVMHALSFEIGRKVLFGALKNKILYSSQSKLDTNPYLNMQSSVSYEDMQALYSNHTLSLNITELRNTYVLRNPVHKMHLRTFEIPMCGGLELVSYTDELAGYFEDGNEIVLYNSDEEFVSKAKFYLDKKNESLCLKMKKSARKRAESDHTWMNRFDTVFKILK